jgi:quinol monooxygenase YgiN
MTILLGAVAASILAAKVAAEGEDEVIALLSHLVEESGNRSENLLYELESDERGERRIEVLRHADALEERKDCDVLIEANISLKAGVSVAEDRIVFHESLGEALHESILSGCYNGRRLSEVTGVTLEGDDPVLEYARMDDAWIIPHLMMGLPLERAKHASVTDLVRSLPRI